jgi:hypothetical protein
MAIRYGPQVEAELDDIWFYIAKENGSIDIAERLAASIGEHFFSAFQASSVRPTTRRPACRPSKPVGGRLRCDLPH